MDLMNLRVFREVVESGSFAAAAQRLDISAPMASKRMSQLEKNVRARLLHRTSRQLSLTEAGHRYYEQCCQALDILDAADESMQHIGTGVRGTLKVSAPVWCANGRFTGVLAAYRRRYPEVVLELRLENRHVDLVADGYDLALRATHTPTETLIARPLCTIRFDLVASPVFMETVRPDADPLQPPMFDAIAPSYLDLDRLIAAAPAHLPRPRLNTIVRTNDTSLAYHAVLAHMGVAFLPDWLVAADLASGRLVRVLGDRLQPPDSTLFAVYTSRQYMAPKLRTFIDFLGEALAA